MEFFNRLVTSIPAVICISYALRRLFGVPIKGWRRLALYLALWTVFTMPSWAGDENPILIFPLFMVLFVLVRPGELLPKLVVGATLYTLFVSVNMPFDTLRLSEAAFLVALAIKALLWCALAWWLVRMVPLDGLRLSQRLWRLLGSLTLGPLVAMLSLSIWGYRTVPPEYYDFYHDALTRMGFTVLPFTLLSSLALLVAAVVLSRHEALEQENRLAALREVYYTGLQQEQTQLRTLRHDLHNHVAALQGLLEQHKSQEAEQYLQALADSPAFAGGRRYCNNDTANVVLASKAAQMEAAGLTPDFAVALPTALSIPAPELCALLGNALDNAIEGAPAGSVVTLRAQLQKGVFMLRVQNRVGRTPNADLTTTKADAAQHGYGLAGMRTIARRQGGSLEAGAKDGLFELLVCFPCTE